MNEGKQKTNIKKLAQGYKKGNEDIYRKSWVCAIMCVDAFSFWWSLTEIFVKQKFFIDILTDTSYVWQIDGFWEDCNRIRSWLGGKSGVLDVP